MQSTSGSFRKCRSKISYLQLLQVLPDNRVLRGRLISFLHRLVECLGERLLPYLPPALSALLPLTADASTVSDVCALLSQLALKYKAALVPLLTEARHVCAPCLPS